MGHLPEEGVHELEVQITVGVDEAQSHDHRAAVTHVFDGPDVGVPGQRHQVSDGLLAGRPGLEDVVVLLEGVVAAPRAGEPGVQVVAAGSAGRLRVDPDPVVTGRQLACGEALLAPVAVGACERVDIVPDLHVEVGDRGVEPHPHRHGRIGAALVHGQQIPVLVRSLRGVRPGQPDAVVCGEARRQRDGRLGGVVRLVGVLRR